jgi:hypothetical protein
MTAEALETELRQLRERVESLEAREQIRDILHRYTRGMDRGDAELVKQGYHPDADDIHWQTFTGNAHQFADYMTAEARTVTYLIHEITDPIIELDGDRAFVESRYTSRVRVETGDLREGTWVEHVARGRYLDIFERRDGVWRIAHRRLVKDGGEYRLVTDQPSHARDLAASGTVWPDDLVYRRYDIADLAPDPQAPEPGHFLALRRFGERMLGRP